MSNVHDDATCKSKLKKFGGDSKSFGDTSLGCGEREAYIDAASEALNNSYGDWIKFNGLVIAALSEDKEDEDNHGVETYLSASETQEVIEQFLSTVNK